MTVQKFLMFNQYRYESTNSHTIFMKRDSLTRFRSLLHCRSVCDTKTRVNNLNNVLI